jgi:hypothetical protein
MGAVTLLICLSVFSLEGAKVNLTATASPLAVLERDRRSAIVMGFLFAFAFGLVIALPLVVVAGHTGLLVDMLLIAVAGGLFIGAIVVLNDAIWPFYIMARGWLALHHYLPWSLMHFLADAHRRGVLRQAGAVYQFRHIELQHRLANRDANEQQASSSTAVP